MAYFSFETSKMINTLGGGMITTRDPDVAARIRAARTNENPRTISWLVNRLLRTSFEATVTSPLPFNLGVYPALRFAPRTGDSKDRFASGYHGDHVTMKGRTGRYTNYQARLGLAQLERGPERVRRLVANAKRLMDPLRDRVSFVEPADPQTKANYMLVTARFPERAAVGDALLRRGIDTKHHYMRDCSQLVDTRETFPNAARAEAEALHLPAFPELSDQQIDRIAAAVRAVVDGPCPSTTGQPQSVSGGGAG